MAGMCFPNVLWLHYLNDLRDFKRKIYLIHWKCSLRYLKFKDILKYKRLIYAQISSLCDIAITIWCNIRHDNDNEAFKIV